MSISKYQELSWENSETFYLSQIWSLYCREVDWEWQLCNLGYFGYADPLLNGQDQQPDVFAFHPKAGDVQIISIKGFDDYTFGEKPESDMEVIERSINEAEQTCDITDECASEYLDSKTHDVNPSTLEKVCVLPNEIYQRYSDYIRRKVNESDLILWLIEPNGKTAIWKEVGEHANLRLDDEISNRMKAYPSSNDILQYARSTDRSRLKFEFISRLVRHCGRENKLSISYSEVDNIMIFTRPPILGHLTKEERKEQYWRDFLYSMINTFELLEESEEETNTYEWTEEKFLNEPRYRHRILKDIRNHLGLEGGQRR